MQKDTKASVLSGHEFSCMNPLDMTWDPYAMSRSGYASECASGCAAVRDLQTTDSARCIRLIAVRHPARNIQLKTQAPPNQPMQSLQGNTAESEATIASGTKLFTSLPR
jgi:hypothetical protein